MPNLIYGSRGTRVTFEPSGGTITFTLTSLASGAGRVSGTHDKGAGSRERHYIGQLRTAWATTPVAGEMLHIYLIEQVEARDGGTPAFKVPGDLGASDAAISDEDRLRVAGRVVGVLEVPPSPASGTEYVSETFEFVTRARKIQVAVWNATADGLSATAGDHELYIEPVDDEIQ